MYANSCGVLRRNLQARHLHRFIRGRKRQVNEATHLLELFLLYEVKRIEIFDFGSDLTRERGGVEMRNLCNAALAGQQARPDLWNRIPDTADQTDPGNDDAPAHYLPFACLSIYSTASFTVRIFSASSSGISMSKASSNAITSSTVSSESAPRSSTNEALGVTSPSSTPSCSTMICFTFSSTEAIDLTLLTGCQKTFQFKDQF